MRNDGPHIEVQHSDQRGGAEAIATLYDMDKGVLSLPEKLRFGQIGHDGTKLMSYAQQVDEYDVWLEDEVKAGNKYVLEALDDIYNLAVNQGVILTTRCCPAPYITHAHVVKRFITKLAS